MVENFTRFKRRIFVIRLFKSIIVGISIGALVSGLLIFLSKIEAIKLNPVIAGVIGVATSLALGCGLFFLLRISDLGLARLLDSELSLDERVETMLQYSGEESAMHRLQREDAEKHLSTASVKILKIHRMWIYIAALVLSLGVFLFSLIYSVPTEEEPPVIEEEFHITELQIKATEQLISSVANSEMASPYRENTVSALTDMLTALKVTETVREKDATVTVAMEKILKEVDDSSGAVELISALWSANTEQAQELAIAINYYDWPTLDEWNKFERELSDFGESFVHPDAAAESPDESKIKTETELLLLNCSSGISSALAASKIHPSDALSLVLARLALADEENEDGTRFYGIQKLSALVSAFGYNSVMRELESTLEIVKGELFDALSVHKENTDTGEDAIIKIGSIFNCKLPKFKRPSFASVSGENSSSGDDETGGGGAIGSGTEYGSDDLVLDPYTNTYVEYGVILERYYALMFAGLESGNYNDAQKEAMEKYFAILYGGFEKGEETDE